MLLSLEFAGMNRVRRERRVRRASGKGQGIAVLYGRPVSPEMIDHQTVEGWA